MSFRAYFERTKPLLCRDCRRKGVSAKSFECRYCGWSCYPPTPAGYRAATSNTETGVARS